MVPQDQQSQELPWLFSFFLFLKEQKKFLENDHRRKKYNLKVGEKKKKKELIFSI